MRDMHSHPFYEVGLVLEGGAEWIMGRRRRQLLRAGDLILIPPYKEHREELVKNVFTRLAWVGFTLEEKPSLPGWSLRAITGGPYTRDFERLFQTVLMESQSKEIGSPLRAELALQEIVVLLYRCAGGLKRRKTGGVAKTSEGSRQTAVADSAARQLTENLPVSVNVASVARDHGLCTPYFTVLFRRRFGVPPREFVTRARVARAKELILDGKHGTKEIAALCGFADVSHFARRFKAATGVTPGQFRARPIKATRGELAALGG
ncbi:MAG TPA: AraC family transcriptional regulator [Rariglobus sp.]|nr:AraC family transcriptional regulator [Rariglobus sp.]